MRTLPLLAALAAAAGAAHAQQFTNGDFASGDLTGWSVEPTANGLTNQQVVSPLDIDGPGPLGVSNAAGFAVGNVVSMPGNQAGIELVQMVDLAAGVQYAIFFNIASLNINTSGSNAEGGVYSITADGATIPGSVAMGSTAAGCARYNFVEALYTPSSSGPKRIGVRITRPFTVPGIAVQQWVDNADVRPFEQGPCCMPGGACADLSQRACTASGGVWAGAGLTCATHDCGTPPTGACCLLDGTCSLNNATACAAAGGTYAGNATVCGAAPCPSNLSTIFNQSTLTTAGAGVFLDLTPVNALTLQRLDLYSASDAGNWLTVRVYTYPGSYVGHDADQTGWTLRETQVLRSGGSAAPMRIRLTNPIPIAPAETLGVYLIADGGGIRFRGTAAAPSAGTFSDANLNVFTDTVRTLPWGGTATTARSFSGNIVYTLPTTPPVCYANCDASTIAPVLNVLDFNCFLNRFSSGDPYANCDGSTIVPVLNVLDFNCFLNAFSAGCP